MSTSRDVDAVLFDIGGVLTTSPFDAFARHEAAHGLPAGFLRSVNATDPDTNAWARLERGELDVEGFDEAFAQESAAAGHGVRGSVVLGLLQGDPRPEMCRAVINCAAHLRVGLVTNNVVPLARSPRSMGLADVIEAVHTVVESAVEGVRKPEPTIYLRACDRLGVDPRRTAFLDDLGVNLKPARALGMHTIKVLDPFEALADLSRLTGLALAGEG